MREFLLDMLCFIALVSGLEACAQNAEKEQWGNLDYVDAACNEDHTALEETCHPHEEDMSIISGRGRGSGGARR
jgi:hypothetical protein